ncbi:hypothetical protein BURMUCF1_A0343 [Burkholderia multivorans ATCC BAA-247]|nr:hypothetical protein BURMUCF1_A0343 [Burkholderia multivorans ATCC BAA-247]
MGPVHSRVDIRSGLRASRWGLRHPDSLPACHGHMCVGSGIVARLSSRHVLHYRECLRMHLSSIVRCVSATPCAVRRD